MTRYRPFRAIPAWLTALFAFMVLAAPASAVNVTVGGTTYDIVFYQGQSFDANQAVLTDPATAPWWGDSALAIQFRDAYQALGAPYDFDVTGSVDSLNFAHAIFGTTVVYHRVTDTGTVSNNSVSTNTTATANHHFAYVAVAPAGPAAVPEIDGNALPKALFILFTLGVWLRVRRYRRGLG